MLHVKDLRSIPDRGQQSLDALSFAVMGYSFCKAVFGYHLFSQESSRASTRGAKGFPPGLCRGKEVQRR
jgi:hypothetical protein